MNLSRLFKKHRVFVAFLAGFIFILMAILFQLYFSFQTAPEKIKRNFETVLRDKEKQVSEKIKELKAAFENPSATDWIKTSLDFQKLSEEKGLAFFVYDNVSLIFWSTNTVPYPERWKNIKDPGFTGIQKLKNGWYEVKEISDSSKTYIGLILLKKGYPLENDFLVNRFQHSFHVPDGTGINYMKGNVSIRSEEHTSELQ